MKKTLGIVLLIILLLSLLILLVIGIMLKGYTLLAAIGLLALIIGGSLIFVGLLYFSFWLIYES